MSVLLTDCVFPWFFFGLVYADEAKPLNQIPGHISQLATIICGDVPSGIYVLAKNKHTKYNFETFKIERVHNISRI